MKCDAAGNLPVVFSEKESSFGRSIATRKFSEFVIEVLEAEAESERLSVFEESSRAWAIWVEVVAWTIEKLLTAEDAEGAEKPG